MAISVSGIDNPYISSLQGEVPLQPPRLGAIQKQKARERFGHSVYAFQNIGVDRIAKYSLLGAEMAMIVAKGGGGDDLLKFAILGASILHFKWTEKPHAKKA